MRDSQPEESNAEETEAPDTSTENEGRNPTENVEPGQRFEDARERWFTTIAGMGFHMEPERMEPDAPIAPYPDRNAFPEWIPPKPKEFMTMKELYGENNDKPGMSTLWRPITEFVMQPRFAFGGEFVDRMTNIAQMLRTSTEQEVREAAENVTVVRRSEWPRQSGKTNAIRERCEDEVIRDILRAGRIIETDIMQAGLYRAMLEHIPIGALPAPTNVAITFTHRRPNYDRAIAQMDQRIERALSDRQPGRGRSFLAKIFNNSLYGALRGKKKDQVL